MTAPTLLTLPELAQAVDIEYRTLHSWIGRGLLRPSMKVSRGTGFPNLFSVEDAVRAKVIADLRRSGTHFDRLQEAAERLDEHPEALSEGAIMLVNGSVSVVDAQAAAAAIEQGSLTLIYNTGHAIREMLSTLG
jgi:DNA-binding transcriptional MerR regulator